MIRLACVFVLGANAGFAQGAPEEDVRRQAVLGCLAEMDVSTTWDQCRTQMFAACAGLEVGAADHLACLTEDKAGWQALMTGYQAVLTERLTSAALLDLTGLMGQWTGYVGQKCADVGEARAEISREAAVLGCEISEIAGLTVEFAACDAGQSTAPYCTLKE